MNTEIKKKIIKFCMSDQSRMCNNLGATHGDSYICSQLDSYLGFDMNTCPLLDFAEKNGIIIKNKDIEDFKNENL